MTIAHVRITLVDAQRNNEPELPALLKAVARPRGSRKYGRVHRAADSAEHHLHSWVEKRPCQRSPVWHPLQWSWFVGSRRSLRYFRPKAHPQGSHSGAPALHEVDSTAPHRPQLERYFQSSLLVRRWQQAWPECCRGAGEARVGRSAPSYRRASQGCRPGRSTGATGRCAWVVSSPEGEPGAQGKVTHWGKCPSKP